MSNQPTQRYRLIAELRASAIHKAVHAVYGGTLAPTLYVVQNHRGTRLVSGRDVAEL